MNQPTAAALLINALTPFERAILHTALRMYRGELADSFRETFSNVEPSKNDIRISQALHYCAIEAQHLTNTLFAEFLLEDLDVVPLRR